MDGREAEEVLKVVRSCLSRAKWRLRPSAMRRLDTDILALCSGLRPAVMVDYGGKMPELQGYLCRLMHFAHKESPSLLPLRVMVIEDMIYMIHIQGLAKHSLCCASSPSQLIFVDLEQDPPKLLMQPEQNTIVKELMSIQKLFSSILSVSDESRHLSSTSSAPWKDIYAGSDNAIMQSSEYINLTSCLKGSHVTLPTLNGWLLGYPVVYLFGKEHIANAINNLSTRYLHLYKIIICRSTQSGKSSSTEELMSFSVPYILSMRGREESWARAFLSDMRSRFERCKHAWLYLQLEVNECGPRAIVL